MMSCDRALSVGGIVLAAFTFLFTLGAVNRLGHLAQTEGQFYLGVLLIVIFNFVMVCCGLLMSVMRQLARRPRA
jgi:uncharacterized membrane protein